MPERWQPWLTPQEKPDLSFKREDIHETYNH